MWINLGRVSVLASLCMAASFGARAAGGHFDVDDATIVNPGRCQVEAWITRVPAEAATVFHVGPACRVGPVEIGLNFDHVRVTDEARNGFGPQLKWVADPLVGSVSAGVVWGAYFDPKQDGRPLQTLYTPFTWAATETLRLNANVGADWGFAGERTRRIGASGEWAASETLTLIAERLSLSGAWISRLGARFTLSQSVSLDLSAARTSPGASRVYVIGLNHDFAR